MRLVLSKDSSVTWLAFSCNDSSSVRGGPSSCAGSVGGAMVVVLVRNLRVT